MLSDGIQVMSQHIWSNEEKKAKGHMVARTDERTMTVTCAAFRCYPKNCTDGLSTSKGVGKVRDSIMEN